MQLENAPVLNPGAAGEWVTYLQQLLAAADHEHRRWTAVAVTGSFDAATEAAVRAFQAWVPIPVTGTVDAMTWQHLLVDAQTMEQLDESMGLVSGDTHAGQHGQKLAAGEQIARAGWRSTNLRVIVEDFNGDPLTGPAYVRFRSSAGGAESDESGHIDDGTLILGDVWVPTSGTLTLYVTAIQDGVESLHGSADLKRHEGDELGFRARQQFDQQVVSTSQARALADQFGTKVVVGAMAGGKDVLPTGSNDVSFLASLEASESFTDTTTHTAAIAVTVRVPRPALEIAPLL